MKELGYSPKIVVSDLYAHSMLLVDVHSSGAHFIDKGKKYYFWETTSIGWMAGIIPAGMTNLKEWDVVLN